MRLYRRIADLTTEGTGRGDASHGRAIAIGNFDGVHPGHRAVIAAAGRAAAARRSAGVAVTRAVLTFEPHPRRFFQPDNLPFALTPLPAKARLIAELGAEELLALPFDADLAGMAAEAFVDDFLVRELAAVHVVVGENFRFGKGRAGDAALMEWRLRALGASMTPIAPVMGPDGQPCSSSRVRDALRAGDVERATGILGRFWEIEGAVLHGDKIGRTIGFPTANIDLGAHLRPATGVYAVQVRFPGDDQPWRDAVASLGYRPAVNGRDLRFEVFVFDFDGDLYEQTLRVRLVSRLRPEEHYDGLEALARQIEKDCDNARALLRETRAWPSLGRSA